MGAPLFKRTTVTFDNGKKLVINAPANGAENRYVQSVALNGKPWNQNWFNHFELLKGGELTFVMGTQPNRSRGTTAAAFPYSFSTHEKGF